VRSLTPLRLGMPLSSIPFVFHGPSHARPEIVKSPIEDIVEANLDHYRLNKDHRHGMHSDFEASLLGAQEIQATAKDRLKAEIANAAPAVTPA